MGRLEFGLSFFALYVAEDEKTSYNQNTKHNNDDEQSAIACAVADSITSASVTHYVAFCTLGRTYIVVTILTYA